MAKIRRCLYIGLGGTGMNALLHTKRMFVETYGKVPPMIAFLGIDTDGGAYEKSLTSKVGPVKLDIVEQMPIQCEDPRSIYNRYKSHFSWFHEKNYGFLTGMKNGAGQFRSNGRFALIVNYKNIQKKLIDTIASISNAQNASNREFEVLGDKIEVHIVFSLCGGTGCGTFLDTALLVRKALNNDCKIAGYGILPDVFELMAKTGVSNVKTNAFGAIQDLDQLMHLGRNSSEKYEVDYIDSTEVYEDRPFDTFFFIDNKNDNGDVYDNVSQLGEMVGLAVATSAGELSAAAASVMDNVNKQIENGSMDVINKKAWAAGIGICEILFRGATLADIASIKYAKRLLTRMTNTTADVNAIANNWIDSENVNIRENKGFDNVIDYVGKKQPKTNLSLNNNQDAKNEVDMWLKTTEMKSDEVDAKIAELSARCRAELRKMVIERINADAGVGNVKGILSEINAQVNSFLGEMNDELQNLTDKKPALDSILLTSINDLIEVDGKFFKLPSTLKEKVEDVEVNAMNAAVAGREIARRNAAVRFYNTFLGDLQKEIDHINDIEAMIGLVNQDLSDRLTRLQNYATGEGNQTFQIDLGRSYATSIEIDESQLNVNEFLKALGYTNDVYDFADQPREENMKSLLAYTDSLPGVKEWRAKNIEEVLRAMDPKELDRTIKLSISKSMPLFTINDHGYMTQEQPSDIFYVGVPDMSDSIFAKGDRFKNQIEGAPTVNFASIGSSDRIIVYRQISVFPAFKLAPVFSYSNRAYERDPEKYHFDYSLYTQMQREGYSLMPQEEVDDSLAMWIKGLIFGLIRNTGETYQIKDNENGDPLDDYWVSLGKYRDDAFKNFKREQNKYGNQFQEFFDNLQSSKGSEYLNGIIADAKLDYLAKYSQVNMTNDQLKAKGFESVRELITNEINFVKKEL